MLQVKFIQDCVFNGLWWPCRFNIVNLRKSDVWVTAFYDECTPLTLSRLPSVGASNTNETFSSEFDNKLSYSLYRSQYVNSNKHDERVNKKNPDDDDFLGALRQIWGFSSVVKVLR